jgi:hypothetical protein
MDPLLWTAVVITALIILLPCAFRLGIEIGKQEAEGAALGHPAPRAFEFQRATPATPFDEVPRFSRAH